MLLRLQRLIFDALVMLQTYPTAYPEHIVILGCHDPDALVSPLCHAQQFVEVIG